MKILTIQDISCYGQCSLTVALPILSSMGIETAILPTAVLSTHTAGFKDFTFCDLTEEMPKIKNHWIKENIKYDGFYTGYVGSLKQLEYILDIYNSCKKDDSVFLVDPVMGDGGKLYPGFSNEFPKEMLKLCKKADIIVPNITEASLMLGLEYKSEYDENYIKEIINGFVNEKIERIVLTGVSFKKGTVGVAVYENNKIEYYIHDFIGGSFHGTGDVYSSVLFGGIMNKKKLIDAAKDACIFVQKAILNTIDDKEHTYGVKFEGKLKEL